MRATSDWLCDKQAVKQAESCFLFLTNQTTFMNNSEADSSKKNEVGQRESEVGSEKSQYKCSFRRNESARFLQIQYVQSNTAAWRKLSTYQLLRLSIFTYRYTINKHSAADWEPVCKTSLSKTSNSETISLTNCDCQFLLVEPEGCSHSVATDD